jgi:hypothetical protein
LRRFQRTVSGEFQMSLLLYLALFIAACGFGWWAKNADKQP